MKAFQLTEWQSPPEFREVPVPEPGPGQVLVKVAGAGACHSDLHLMEWPPGTLSFDVPFTLGHENAGWVESLGAGVEGLETGEAVAVYGPWGCGRCRACRRSAENYCERQAEIGAFGGGLGLDGGMAEYMLVPHPRLLLPLGDLDPRDAAPLSDAALTPYHAIKRSLHLLVPGSTAVVIGVGGLGHMGVQILRALSPAQIVAVDISDEKLRLAIEVGADETVKAGEEAAEAIREITHGLGAELVLDMVGTDESIALAVAVARFESQLTIVGLAGGKYEFAFGALPFEAQLTIPYWGSAIELEECLELARQGEIRAHVERFSLDDAPKAYAKMRAGELDGRAVVCPHGDDR
ncbi:MAG TPA: NAD(P)-dependent alcohol dehydrogenase [Solirubrobacterales bacterium]|nr:NAD(P)-dependent alcohol dehydrogenase [Solirubrobacterales bacterium]